MARTREPGDPWHTVLTHEPHRLWWVPALVVLLVLLAGRRVSADETLLGSLVFATLVSAASLVVSGLRRRSRRRA